MEQHYKIAGLTVQMDTFGRTLTQAEPYRIPASAAADIVIRTDWRAFQKEQPHLSDDESEYIVSGANFYRQFLHFDGMMLHASAVVMDGRAYLFSAPSGTGKSTHTALWQQVFGDDRVQILNDDKPALRMEDGQWFAYGTPWSCKTEQNLNLRVPLGGICILRRGVENRMEPAVGRTVIFDLLNQTLRPKNAETRIRLLIVLDQLLEKTPVWRLTCNMEPAAARLSYEAMSRGLKGANE